MKKRHFSNHTVYAADEYINKCRPRKSQPGWPIGKCRLPTYPHVRTQKISHLWVWVRSEFRAKEKSKQFFIWKGNILPPLPPTIGVFCGSPDTFILVPSSDYTLGQRSHSKPPWPRLNEHTPVQSVTQVEQNIATVYVYYLRVKHHFVDKCKLWKFQQCIPDSLLSENDCLLFVFFSFEIVFLLTSSSLKSLSFSFSSSSLSSSLSYTVSCSGS